MGLGDDNSFYHISTHAMLYCEMSTYSLKESKLILPGTIIQTHGISVPIGFACRKFEEHNTRSNQYYGVGGRTGVLKFWLQSS